MLKLSVFVLFYFVFNILFLSWLMIFRKNSYINQFFYYNIKHILKKQENSTYNILHLLNEILYLFFTIRFIKIWVFMSSPKLNSNYDFFNIFFQSFSNEKDYFFVCIFVFLFLFCLLIEPLLYFSPVNTITFLKYSDLVINNYDVYKNYSLMKNFSRLQKQSTFLKFINLIKFNSFEADQSIFLFSKLEHFPNLSFNLRAKFVKFLIIIEKLFTITIIGLCKWFLLK